MTGRARQPLCMLALIFALTLVVAACAGDDDTAAPEPAPEDEPEDEPEPEPEEEPTEEAGDDWDAVLAAAQEEGEVNVRSVFPEAIELELFSEFERETGIRLNYSRAGGSGPTVQQYLTEVEAGQHLADVLQLTIEPAIDLAERGLMAAVDLPAIQGVVPEFVQEDTRVIQTMVASVPIVYNINLLSEDELPDTYAELNDPRFENMIAIGGPENSAQMVRLAYHILQTEGEDWIQEFAGLNVIETDREVEAADLMARGERAIGPMTQTSPAQPIAEGAPLAIHWIQGILVGPYAAVIPEEAPNPNAARVFLNWLLERGHQDRIVERLGIFPVIQDGNSPEGFPDLVDLNPVVYPIEDIIEARDDVISTWRGIMG